MFDEELFEERLRNFKPEPLVSQISNKNETLEIPIVEEDSNSVDLAKVNYLNFLDNTEVKKIAEETIRIYGVGTCGPRHFYGTTLLHEELEKRLAEFMQMKDAMVYSCGFIAVSDSVTAYCGSKDVIFIDEYANDGILRGCKISRSKILKFKHNSTEDFERKIQTESNNNSRYLVIEGISWNTGKLCPLPDFLKIAEKHKIRVFLEESYSIGVLGATGRGLTEHFNIAPNRVDMIFGKLEGAISSIGGFCVSAHDHVIDLHKFHGSGYLFSASLPTYLTAVAIKELKLIQDKPKTFQKLTKLFHEFLHKVCGFNVVSDPEAPFKLVKLEPKINETKVHHYCKERGIHFIHNENGLVINLNIKLFEDKELERVYEVFREAADLIK